MATDKLVDFDHVTDYISREAAIKAAKCHYPKANEMLAGIVLVPTADVRPVPPGGIGEMSDGYHTFNGLYYQRMVLFAALVKQNKDSAWKSHRHEDGELCFGGGWFIVGLDTPKGSYTYHYEDKDWDLFDCEELPVGKHWDGHTEDDVTRLLSLPEMRPVVRGKWEIANSYAGPGLMNLRCSVCGEFGGTWMDCTLPSMLYKFCPNCGAEMRNTAALEDATQDADAGAMAPAT